MTSPDGRYTFNPPSTWPAPPAGWVPEAGWKPDPGWPPAPEGWQFWLPVETPEQPASGVPQRQGVVARLDPRKALEDAQARKAERGSRDPEVGLTVEGNALVQADEPPVHPVAAALPATGFLAARKERKTAEQLARQQADAEAAVVQKRQQLLARRASLQEQIEFVEGWPRNVRDSGGLVLKKGEHPVGVLEAAGLVEVKRQTGHYVSGSSGVSIRVAKGVRVRAGASRGHYVPGDEAETQVDTGSAVITNQRIVFSGSRQTREWKFDNLLGRQFVSNKQIAWIELPVSNRQKMSALSFPKSVAGAALSAVELALVFHGEGQADLVEHLREQLAQVGD